MDDSFGVFPDGGPGPSAVFGDLEDAIAWGLGKYGADHFTIRYCPLQVLERTTEEPCRTAC
jgi:hypothetical protein